MRDLESLRMEREILEEVIDSPEAIERPMARMDLIMQQVAVDCEIEAQS